MRRSAPGMDTSGLTSSACLAVLILETSAGVLTSVYVIVIILLDFYQKKNIRPGNKIRIALSLSNCCYSIISFARIFIGFFWPVISRTTSANYVLYAFTIYCISSCSWFHASLSFFYFMKIVNVKSRCFLWVKTNISPIVSWMILVAEIVAFGSFFSVFSLVPQPSSHNISVPSYDVEAVSDLRHRFIYIVVVVTFVPLVTVMVSTITTAVVLKQHRQKMEQNMGPSSNVRLETYKSEFFRMLRLLFFFIIFYPLLLSFYLPVFAEMSPGFWAILIIMTAFSPIQSIIIALDDPKLKRLWRKLSDCVRSCSQ